jgi:hypothetical protein
MFTSAIVVVVESWSRSSSFAIRKFLEMPSRVGTIRFETSARLSEHPHLDQPYSRAKLTQHINCFWCLRIEVRNPPLSLLNPPFFTHPPVLYCYFRGSSQLFKHEQVEG